MTDVKGAEVLGKAVPADELDRGLPQTCILQESKRKRKAVSADRLRVRRACTRLRLGLSLQ